MEENKGKPGQVQSHQPGKEHKMDPTPEYLKPNYKGSGKLKDKVAIISGGDSGIGRAVAVLFASEGAKVAIAYLEEDRDAEETKRLVEEQGGSALLVKADLSKKSACKKVVSETLETFGQLNIIINNAAQQYVQRQLEDIDEEQLRKTFETNIFSYFFLTQAALPHLSKGDSVVNTASVTAYRGKPELIDYSSTKGAIVAFTRSLSTSLASKNIRVNGVAPGPIWTPLIPASFSKEEVGEFGVHVPLGRPGEPSEVAPAFLFLASDEASYITGQFIHPNGGEILNT
ncbi:NAD(P)-dependent oxidoreductase [Echinicola strongylocentroti]|uniref:NAD(P)-dependent oxidoreductase n=1 Tax=Echinicola strongylocentroti TaxID=1795355 RepID=A0A2Z4ILL5_9BACT|nr:SDR family oxidoreductase [Echinicola strongylocentroti]AWW32012.1 NAD(P)-dependent oxidoreductase [Echinicola strongylocentroti]